MRLLLLLALLTTSIAMAQNFKFNGDARVRSEGFQNYDLSDQDEDTDFDENKFTGYRFRLGVKASKAKDSKTHVFMQFRATKTAGSDGLSGGLDAESNTVDMHQGYLAHSHGDAMLKAGRQEVAFGDHFFIGNVGWHNVGRSFDGFRVDYKSKYGTTTAFSFTTKEIGNTTGTASTKDQTDDDLIGFYHSASFASVKNLDVYAVNDTQDTGVSNTNILSIGLRVKSNFKKFDYRVEYVTQTVKTTGSDTETGTAYDVELGYSINKFRVAAERSSANEFFSDTYSTKHKWLGHMDLYHRTNISQIAVHFRYIANDKLKVFASYHIFSRVVDDATGFAWLDKGTAKGGDETDLGTELDLYAKYALHDDLGLQVGYSMFIPGDYYDPTDGAKFSYFQLSTKF